MAYFDSLWPDKGRCAGKIFKKFSPHRIYSPQKRLRG